MTSLDLTHMNLPSMVIPLAGRIILDIEPKPERIGSLHVPDIAREQVTSDTSLLARVVSVGYGPYYEGDTVNGKMKHKRHPGVTRDDVRPGARVVFRALMQDLNCKRILTSVTRIDAVIE